MNSDENYMLRTMDLARLGLGSVSPNPLVGCVVVHENRIIGEGWHRKFGGPHAEVNAIQSVKDPGLLSESTVYVNLEPCSFQGKTPPCTDLLISSKVKRVVISTEDPNPRVSGEGIRRLREAGIEVVTAVLKEKGLNLNRRFFVNQIGKRPYIILKWARTSDGFIAREDYSSKWISSKDSRKLVHKWRAEEDAVLVGRRTVEWDDPQLNVRDWDGKDPKDPVRVVFDPSNQLPDERNVKDGKIPTLIFNNKIEVKYGDLEYVKIESTGNFLDSVMLELSHRDIGSVLVEGGTETIQSFVNLDLWDEARVFISEKSFGKGITGPKITGDPDFEEKISDDLLKHYVNRNY